jgi:gliding motility-associated-like protein
MYFERTILSLFSVILTLHVYSSNAADTCGVKAKYSPGADTVVSNENPILILNQSINSNSFNWYTNDSFISAGKDLLLYPIAAVTEIMLVASNGICNDTAYSYVILNGNFSGQYNNFQKQYNPPGEAMDPFCITGDKSNGYLLTGDYYLPSENNFESKTTSLFHIDEKGCIDWSKTLTEGQEEVIQAVISTSDSGFLICAFPFQSQQDNYPRYLNMFKLDKSGNEVWAHSISDGTNVINYFSAICETTDGGFALEVGSFPLSGNPSGISIIKIDQSGRFIWGRKLSVETDAYYDIGGILEKGNFIYTTGSVYQAMAPFDILRSFLVKIDETTGLMIWSKKNDPAQAPLTFTDMHSYKDSLLINSYFQNLLNDFIYLDNDGNFGRSLLVNNPYGSLNGKENVTVSANNGIYFHQTSGNSGIPDKDIIMRIDSNNQIAWQYDFSTINLNFSGWNQLTPAPANGIAGIGRGFMANSFNDLTFLKLDAKGTGCNLGATSLSLSANQVSLVPMSWNLNSSLSLTVQDFPLGLNDKTIEARLICPKYLDGCDLLKLQGPSKICHVGDTVRYFLHADPFCADPITWSFDSKNIKALSSNLHYSDLKFMLPGNFVIKVYKDGCNQVADSIIVSVGDLNSKVNLPVDTVLCSGSILKLDAGTGYTNYLWQDGSNEQTMDVIDSGMYWVRLTDQNGCVNTDSVRIGSIKKPPALFLPPDTTICTGDILNLRPVRNFEKYKWSTGETGNSIQIEYSGNYTLQVVDIYGCAGSDSILVETKSCPKEIFFPNAFTPNKDGLNDNFKPVTIASPVIYLFKIYNRFGQLIFKTNDPGKGWDGTVGNIDQESGAYVWMCTYQFTGGKKNVASGTVLLLR